MIYDILYIKYYHNIIFYYDNIDNIDNIDS
jgi:hypothetical protein